MTNWTAVAGLLAASTIAYAAPPSYVEVSDATALVKACAAIGADGGTIRLRPGVYALTKPLHLDHVNHMNLLGSGWNTTIRAAAGQDGLVFTDCGFCVVRGLMIVGETGGTRGSGILFQGQSSSCTVDFCRMSSFPQSGIRYEGDAKRPQSSNTVSRCHFIDNAGDQLYSGSNNDFYIRDNQFGAHTLQGDRAPRSGVLLDHSSAGTYTANYHWGNCVALRMGPGCNFDRIENNRFEESREQGILIGDPAGGDGLYLNILTGNTIHTNSQAQRGKFDAVEAYNAQDLTFCTNQVFSWDSATLRHRHALTLGKGCKTWIVKDNILRHCTEKALVYEEGAGHIVKDNIAD